MPQETPEQAFPEADQLTPALPTSFVTTAVTASVCPTASPPRFGEIVTLTAPVEDVTVIVALAVLLVSSAEVAVNVTAGFAGRVAGAVYVTDVAVCAERAPQALVQALPACVRDHVTPFFAGSFATVAVNAWVAEMFTDALVGEMLTDTGAVTVMVAAAFFAVFDTEVAIRVTFAGFGTVPGAW